MWSGSISLAAQAGRESPMDLIMIGIGVVFFALATAYIRACENL
jgi:hypothetical protein